MVSNLKNILLYFSSNLISEDDTEYLGIYIALVVDRFDQDKDTSMPHIIGYKNAWLQQSQQTLGYGFLYALISVRFCIYSRVFY
jgi:hypothetical protein